MHYPTLITVFSYKSQARFTIPSIKLLRLPTDKLSLMARLFGRRRGLGY